MKQFRLIVISSLFLGMVSNLVSLNEEADKPITFAPQEVRARKDFGLEFVYEEDVEKVKKNPSGAYVVTMQNKDVFIVTKTERGSGENTWDEIRVQKKSELPGERWTISATSHNQYGPNEWLFKLAKSYLNEAEWLWQHYGDHSSLATGL